MVACICAVNTQEIKTGEPQVPEEPWLQHKTLSKAKQSKHYSASFVSDRLYFPTHDIIIQVINIFWDIFVFFPLRFIFAFIYMCICI